MSLVEQGVVKGTGGVSEVGIDDANGTRISPLALSTSITAGSKTVPSAGTAVALVASSTPCKMVIVQANYTNNGYILVGGATVSTLTGIALVAGFATQPIWIDNANKVYINATVDGEGATYIYTT